MEERLKNEAERKTLPFTNKCRNTEYMKIIMCTNTMG